jgi:hypothetical protein
MRSRQHGPLRALRRMRPCRMAARRVLPIAARLPKKVWRCRHRSPLTAITVRTKRTRPLAASRIASRPRRAMPAAIRVQRRAVPPKLTRVHHRVVPQRHCPIAMPRRGLPRASRSLRTRRLRRKLKHPHDQSSTSLRRMDPDPGRRRRDLDREPVRAARFTETDAPRSSAAVNRAMNTAIPPG